MIGSFVNSLYTSDLEGSLGALQPQAQATAGDSIGAASGLATQLPPETASGLLTVAGDAFTDAMGTGLLVAGTLAAIAAVLVFRFLPSRTEVSQRDRRLGTPSGPVPAGERP